MKPASGRTAPRAELHNIATGRFVGEPDGGEDPLACSLLTFTGRWVNPFRLTAADIAIEDIAHALAHLCRFTGHTREFYSVAQHSVLVAARVEARVQTFALSRRLTAQQTLFALLHDASEAYLGDVATPHKQMPHMARYRVAEKQAQRVIHEALIGRCCPLPTVGKLIQLADRRELAQERAVQMAEHPRWPIDPADVTGTTRAWSSDAAEHLFLTMYDVAHRDVWSDT